MKKQQKQTQKYFEKKAFDWSKSSKHNSTGIINTILVKSGHEIDEINSNSKFTLDSIKDIHQAIKY